MVVGFFLFFFFFVLSHFETPSCIGFLLCFINILKYVEGNSQL